MFQRRSRSGIVWSFLFVVTAAALANTQAATPTTGVKIARTKPNIFDPVLSSNVYNGRVKENEQIVQIEPTLYANDADPSNSNNGKICGYELSWHKHDDLLDEITRNIPFSIEVLEGQQRPVLKVKSTTEKLDCETKQTYRLFVRAYDCAQNTKRRYSERSSLIITIDDVNEFAPVFTHDNYLFKLHQGQTCATSGPAACRIEATDDDCSNSNNRVCGYEIITPDVPFTIDVNGAISVTQPLLDEKYDFDVVAVDCYPTSSTDNTKKKSRPTRVTFKVIKTCKPTITDESPAKIVIQSDHIHVFDTVHVDTCDETCVVEDIVGTIDLDANGSDSGCKLEQCSSTDQETVLIQKDNDYTRPPVGRFMSFDGHAQAQTVDNATFSGHFNPDSTIRMWMKHASDNSGDKEHIFCKSDNKLKNRHHAALFVQNDYLKFLLRKGPMSPNDNIQYASEWLWQLTQLNDNQWHSYKLVVHYPDRVDLFVDENLIAPTNSNHQVIKDYPLAEIDGTEGTVLTLGACWHGRASRMVQHFHGQLSGLTVQQKTEVPRSAGCTRECQQFLDMPDIKSQPGAEFVSNTNRSLWILRTDSTETFEQLLKHVVYRNTFDPVGPPGQRTVSLRTNVKCVGENYVNNLPAWNRLFSIDEPSRPVKIELKGDTNFFVPEDVINQGIYLFRNMSIFTDALKTNQADISDCSLTTSPDLSYSEELIVPDLESTQLEKVFTKTGLMLSGSTSIDNYQFILQQIAYISKSPVKYLDRQFALVCVGAVDQSPTNEIRVRVHIQKQIAPPAPVASILSNKLLVDNDQSRDNLLEVREGESRTVRNATGWPIAVVVCVSVGLALMLVLYLVVRIRSSGKQRGPSSSNGDDVHSQMEWEDDIGLNITVNPLDETKKPISTVNMHDVEQTLHEYAGSSSDEDCDDSENDIGHNRNEYSSDEDYEEENRHIRPKKPDHQLEWDDAAIEYGPKKV